MKTLVRCPHCTQMIGVDSIDNWQTGEVLFTECYKCLETFTIRKDAKGVVVHRSLPLPKPTRAKLSKVSVNQ